MKPLKKPDGGHITGLPTSNPATDVPYDFDLNVLPFDEDSLDAEGITIDPWGNFWVCDESKPSVAMIAPNGKVQLRLVPAGTLTGVEEVPTYDVLPGVLAKRRNNRGLEGIAAAADGILYAVMQRPLNNPNRAAADANGNGRLAGDQPEYVCSTAAPRPLVRQYLYHMPREQRQRHPQRPVLHRSRHAARARARDRQTVRDQRHWRDGHHAAGKCGRAI